MVYGIERQQREKLAPEANSCCGCCSVGADEATTAGQHVKGDREVEHQRDQVGWLLDGKKG